MDLNNFDSDRLGGMAGPCCRAPPNQSKLDVLLTIGYDPSDFRFILCTFLSSCIGVTLRGDVSTSTCFQLSAGIFLRSLSRRRSAELYLVVDGKGAW